MANLNCSANNCVHNCSGSCYAGSIKVDGKQATTTANTFCSSFEDRNSSGLNNVASSENEVCPNDIHCDACNCNHNQNCSCTASNVNINMQNASCETFKC